MIDALISLLIIVAWLAWLGSHCTVAENDPGLWTTRHDASLDKLNAPHPDIDP